MKVSTTAERLKTCLTHLRMKQTDLLAALPPICEACGVKMNKSDLSQYLSGKTTPSADKMMALALALDVDVAWLMGYDVPMRKDVAVQNLEEIPGVMPVREEERRLVTLYRSADETYRRVALELLEAHPKT